MNYSGSCLCGKMRYETGELSAEIDHCHCTFCQKSHGSAFATYAGVIDPETFKWVHGGEDVGRYQSSTHSARLFCKACGSPLAAEIDGGKLLGVTVATLDDELVIKSSLHAFTRSKVKWIEIAEEDTAYDEYPPAFSHFTATD